MWWELAIDVLWPRRRATAERRVESGTSDPLPVQVAIPGALTRRLNESGWLDDEVLAAGVLRQGSPPSLFALLTGAALFGIARSRRAKSLPREFALALTADRAVAFAIGAWKEGDGATGSVAVVKVKPGERGSWPREAARLQDPHERVATKGATLHLPGLEPFPVMFDDDPCSAELIALLDR